MIAAAKKPHSGYRLDSTATLIQCDRCHEAFANTTAAFAHRNPFKGACHQPLKCGLTPRIKQGQRVWDVFQL